MFVKEISAALQHYFFGWLKNFFKFSIFLTRCIHTYMYILFSNILESQILQKLKQKGRGKKENTTGKLKGPFPSLFNPGLRISKLRRINCIYLHRFYHPFLVENKKWIRQFIAPLLFSILPPRHHVYLLRLCPCSAQAQAGTAGHRLLRFHPFSPFVFPPFVHY